MFKGFASVYRLPSAAAAAAALAIFLLVPGEARAQQADAAIFVGTVTDPSDGALPGSVVIATNVATGVTTTAVSNERGQYRTPPVRPGTYEISVELDGFKRFVERGVLVNIGDVRTVNVTLQVGDLSDSVTVEGVAPVLSSGDSTVGTVITATQIEALPLNGRDYLQLATLTPGTGPTSGEGVVIGGQSGSNVAFLLDGQDNNSQQISTGHSGQKEVVKPSIDSIAEFKVVTNSYAAEYGRSSSGVVSVSLKAGSNRIRGAAYEFFRDDRFDSKNYFSNTKPDLNRHQFGGALGGPIIANRTFFFVDFEQGVRRSEETNVSTLPSASVRGGVFPATIRDPLNGGQPFPNNTIPASRLDPVAQNILQYIPLPQTDAATNNFVHNSRNDQRTLRWTARVDHVVNAHHNFYVRFSNQTTDNKPTSALPPDATGNFVTGGARDLSINRAFVAVYNAVWTPNVISSVRVGWNKTNWDEAVPSQALRGAGIPGVDNTQPIFGQISITGFRSLGVTNVPNDDDSTNKQISGDVTWTTGAHTFKAGGQAYQLAIDFYSSQRSAGTFTIDGTYTGNGFADFLLGYVRSATLSKWAILNFRTPYTHFFVQDDWRVGRRLTLNLGLRYELNPPPVDENDAIANFDLDTDPENPRIVLPYEDRTGRAARALVDVNYKLFAPRVGFAYSLPGDLTVLRGGAGVFYGNMITVGGMQSLEINPPNHVRVSRTTDPAVPSLFLKDGFAADALDPKFARDVQLNSWDRSNKHPTSYQWNFNVQRQLPGRVVLEVGYTGNRLVNDWWQFDANWAPPGPGNVSTRRRFPTAVVPGTEDVFTLSNVTRNSKIGWSQQHALSTKVEKRYAGGLSLLATYTYSRTRGLNSGYQDPLNLDAEIGPTSNDRPHYFVGSGLYELPFGHRQKFGSHWNRIVDGILGGWAVSPIVTAVSGSPLNVTVNGNPSNSTGTDRPNLVGDPHVDAPTVDRWFNTEAFERNAPFTFGNTPRNFLSGPGRFNVAITIRKSFRVNERVTADLRFESFNVLNTVNWGNPNTLLGNQNFGRISSAGTARNNQIALKLNW